MHTIKANGGRLLIQHQRSFEEIHDKPHIARWVGRDEGVVTQYWAVYYLMGKQSRIRCNIHATIRGAIEQVRHISRANATAKRYLTC